MTTVHQFVSGHDGGGGGPDDREDSLTFGPAAAGDILFLVTNAGGGAWDEVPTLTDSGTSAGWSFLWDESVTGGPDGGMRTIGWKKIADGGETSIHVVWSGPVNHVSVGAWLESPGLPDLVSCGIGAPSNHFGSLEFTNTIPVPDSGATYIGGVAWANAGVFSAQFVTPTTMGGVGFLTAGQGVGNIQHYNNDEGGNTAGQTLTYTFAPADPVRIFEYWVATAEASGDVTLRGTGHLLASGETPLSAEGGFTALEGTGHLLIDGTVPLSQEGGEGLLRGIGHLLGGGLAPLSAPAPFPPQPNTPPMTGQLDCGIYDVFIFTRGLGQIVGRIPFNQLNWTRVLDDTSSAEVTVDGVSNAGTMAHCCQLLGSIEPWEHEIGIYRNGLRVWSGPVVHVSYPSEQVVIDALDLSAWLAVRYLHYNHNFVAPNADLATNWLALVDDAMSVEDSAGLFAHVQALTGVQGERLYTQDMGTLAADAISELARTGLDWYCVDRRMVGGPVAVQPPAYPDAQPLPTLIDESFRDAPQVDRDGNLMGNSWFVGGSGAGPGGNSIIGVYGPEWPGPPDFPDHVHQAAAPDYSTIEGTYGRIERRVNETKILDQPSIDQNAATRYDLTKLPVDVISSGTLLPTAGIDIRQLTPGSLQNVHLTRACVQIGAPYRLKQLTVTAANDGSEDVEGAWEPIGSVAAHEDLG